MTIDDFLRAIDFKGIFDKFNAVHSGVRQNVVENKISDTTCQLFTQSFSNSSWRLTNKTYIFAELHKINDDVFQISRNVLSDDSASKSLLGGGLRDIMDPQLPMEVTIDNRVFVKKQFGFDYLYINNLLPDNEFLPISSLYKMITIPCTNIRGVYIPSKKAKRTFMVTNGTIYTEGLTKPIHYNVFANPTGLFSLSSEDIMIIASMKALVKRRHNNISDLEELRKAYVEKTVNKLLKLE